MSFVWGRAKAIAQKEIYHVMRDPFTLALALGLPLFMVFIFGLAIEFNIKNINLAVVDDDRTQSSRRLVEVFSSSDYFIIKKTASLEDAYNDILGDKARAALIIPGGFQRDVFNGRTGNAQVLLDGSDNSTVVPILGYLDSIQTLAANRLFNFKPTENLKLVTKFLFNSELNSRWFVIPGLTVTVMAILSVLLTSLTVSREWENGSMELLLSTPAEPLEIIVGKLVPYAFLGLASVAFIYVMSITVFDIPFRGNILVFGLGAILFLVTYLSQGLLISVLVRVQQIAMQAAMMTGMLPAQLLSGFIFPIENMPEFFRYFTAILPARWFMTIARQSYLRGSTFIDLWVPFLALTILCALMILLAVIKFKKDLEP